MVKIRVLVADGESLFREGVCALLQAHRDMKIVGEATNGEETVEIVRKQAPDIVLMNTALPIIGGVEATRRIGKDNRDIKVLLLTQYEDTQPILSGLRAGAKGYLPKRATASDLVTAIRAIHGGGYFLYPSVAKTLVKHYLRMRQSQNTDPYDKLTPSEKEVLRLTAEGRSSRETANLLGIAVKTVQSHRTSIMRKLDIHNRAELARYAVRKHLVDLESGSRM